MALYRFRCPACKAEDEAFLKPDAPPVWCKCGTQMERLIGPFNIQGRFPTYASGPARVDKGSLETTEEQIARVKREYREEIRRKESG